MSYEESDISHGAKVTAAVDSYTILRGHITVHTQTLPILFLLLFVATGFQGLSAFEGELWKFEHHYDFFSSEFHQFAVNVSDVLGHEHPFHEYRKNHPEVHQDHPHHHSNLEKMVRSHAQMDFLWISFHAYFLIPFSTLARCYFFLKTQSYLTTLVIMCLILVSGVGQCIALVGNMLVFFHTDSIWIYIKLFITLLVLLIEISTLKDLYDIRKYVMYLSQKYHEHKQEELFNSPDTHSEKEKKEIREMIAKPLNLYDIIQTSIAEFDNFIHLKPKKNKNKNKMN